ARVEAVGRLDCQVGAAHDIADQVIGIPDLAAVGRIEFLGADVGLAVHPGGHRGLPGGFGRNGIGFGVHDGSLPAVFRIAFHDRPQTGRHGFAGTIDAPTDRAYGTVH